MKTEIASYTPGPWEACANGGDDTNLTKCYVVTKARRAATTIADCSYPMDEAEQEANARLIAAAPDLLEALQALMATDPLAMRRDCYTMSRAAIAAATIRR